MCQHEDYPCCGCDGEMTARQWNETQDSAREEAEAEEWERDEDDFGDDDYEDDVDLQQEMHDVSQAMGGPDEDFGCYGNEDW